MTRPLVVRMRRGEEGAARVLLLTLLMTLVFVEVEVEVVVEVDAGCTLAGIALCAFAATMQSPSAILSNARDVGARTDVWASVEDDAMLLVMVASGGSSCEGRGANARKHANTMCAGFSCDLQVLDWRHAQDDARVPRRLVVPSNLPLLVA